MAKPSRDAVLVALLERHGRTYCDELETDIEKGTPSPLFRWLCASRAVQRPDQRRARRASGRRAGEARLDDAQKLADATWKERVRTLKEYGYARFDERTATMLGETCDIRLDRDGGDLRRLREEAEREPKRERSSLKELKGIGDVGRL